MPQYADTNCSLSSHSDVLDIVNDQLSGGDYKPEEDPRLYVSQKTGRGPLPENWIQEPPNGIIMCAYKLIKVSCSRDQVNCCDSMVP